MTDRKCSKCGKDAVIYRKHEGRALCKKHFSIDINRQVKKTIRENGIVESGDRIAVGLSGGKDSALLLEQLVEIFGERPDIEIFAIAVDEGIEGYRDESLANAEKICSDLGVELERVGYGDEYGFTMDEIAGRGEHGACTYCGIMRRDLLNRTAREMGADKIAIGHNLDDEAQAIMMNHIKGDKKRLARIGPENAVENDKFVPRIKPLRDIPEKETQLYSELHDLGVIATCPHISEGALRPHVGEFMDELEEQMPGIKYSIVSNGREISSIVEESMDFDASENELRECDNCGEPSSSEICRKCRLLDEIEGEQETVVQ